MLMAALDGAPKVDSVYTGHSSTRMPLIVQPAALQTPVNSMGADWRYEELCSCNGMLQLAWVELQLLHLDWSLDD